MSTRNLPNKFLFQRFHIILFFLCNNSLVRIPVCLKDYVNNRGGIVLGLELLVSNRFDLCQLNRTKFKQGTSGNVYH